MKDNSQVLGWEPSIGIQSDLSRPGGGWHRAVRLHPPDGDEGIISSCRFSPDGQYIATAGESGVLRVHDLKAGGAMMGAFTGHEGGINDVCWDRESRFMITASSDGTSRLYDIQTSSRPIANLGVVSDVACTACLFPRSISSVAFTGGYDGMISRWDMRMLVRSQYVKGHESPVTSLCASSDDRIIVSGSYDSVSRIWSSLLHLLRSVESQACSDLRLSHNDRLLLCQPFDGINPCIWDMNDPAQVLRLAPFSDPPPMTDKTRNLKMRLRQVIRGDTQTIPKDGISGDVTPPYIPTSRLELSLEPLGHVRACFWRDNVCLPCADGKVHIMNSIHGITMHVLDCYDKNGIGGHVTAVDAHPDIGTGILCTAEIPNSAIVWIYETD
eukprot:GHVO01039359.1.p1 GENE.GHVO01039359.1~~GHVO01039359.1.p1  ORF type:complete len:384 (-),score=76.92 GHVO01039359.1:73-1224(-)